MARGVRVMSAGEASLRKAVRDYLKKGGRTYSQSVLVKEAVDAVLNEARQDALKIFEPESAPAQTVYTMKGPSDPDYPHLREGEYADLNGDD